MIEPRVHPSYGHTMLNASSCGDSPSHSRFAIRLLPALSWDCDHWDAKHCMSHPQNLTNQNHPVSEVSLLHTVYRVLSYEPTIQESLRIQNESRREFCISLNFCLGVCDLHMVNYSTIQAMRLEQFTAREKGLENRGSSARSRGANHDAQACSPRLSTYVHTWLYPCRPLPLPLPFPPPGRQDKVSICYSKTPPTHARFLESPPHFLGTERFHFEASDPPSRTTDV